jgi:ketosteroid isomerase-like protein
MSCEPKVQTLEAKRSLADLDKDLLHDRVVAIFAHWEAGNIDRMLDFATDDIICFPPSTWRYAVYSRRIVGKEAVREALRQRDINYDRMISTVHRIIVDGDEAAVHRTTTIRERGSGALHTFDCVNFLRFRDGLVSEFQEFPDGSAYDAVINFPH